ncbi:hypothetical protein ACFS07_14330 [Undibacterium arcticum]
MNARGQSGSAATGRLLSVLTVLITLLYPLALWLGNGQVEPRLLAGLLLLAALTRVPALKASRLAWFWLGGALLLAALTLWGNAMLPLKLYPVLVNVAMLGLFGASLLTPQSLVERLARLREPEFPPAAVAYTRRVTQVWCAFLYSMVWRRWSRRYGQARRSGPCITALSRIC